MSAKHKEQRVGVFVDVQNLYYSAKKLKAAGLQNQHPDWAVDTIRQKVRDIFLYART